MYSRIGRYILRYLVFMGIPYLLAKRLEKLVMNKLNPETIQILNKELKKNKFPEIENIAQPTRDGLDSRGGAVGPLGLWFVKTVVVDMAIKAAVVGGFWATIYGPAADSAASNLVKYAGAIVSAPGNKFKRFYKKLKGLNPDYHAEIREILLDKELTNSDKLALIKLKIEQAVKNLKGARRKKVILLLMATIIFTLWGNVGSLAFFMERLRGFLGRDDETDLRDSIIDVYYEYNAPLPKDLVEKIPKTVFGSLENRD